MVPDLDIVYASADRFDDTTAFVAENDGEGALGVVARERVGVSAITSALHRWGCQDAGVSVGGDKRRGVLTCGRCQC